jgi:ATP-dependent helicase/nuclease subunit A
MTVAEQPIQDEQQRQQALDATKSFIVQAPAGSGKTELLTQRFLLLLSCVNAPEEILAITFTKKAAAEMRARIVKTLQHAANDPEPEVAHAKKTWRLARQALQQSERLQWDLLQNPSRLRVQTIDSFNASLVKRLPILSQFGAPPALTDDATHLYREAIKEFPAHLEGDSDWAAPIAKLLQHCDNDINKIESLLVSMLAKRDQWLPFLMTAHSAENLRLHLESHLNAVVNDLLVKVKQLFSGPQADELMQLAKFAAVNLTEQGSLAAITQLKDMDKLPGVNADNLPLWLALKNLLLTSELQWRKRLTKNEGFPAPSTAKKTEKQLFENMKDRMTALLEEFADNSQLLAVLSELHFSPTHVYNDNQWQVLTALHHILLLAIAELYVVFRNHGKVDYIQNALAALTALGDEEAPTDLALALDYQIKHILIDEFQDTSSSQYRLLRTLTAGWENGDGRTLFIVGDPMQSIYRFREADVGLFIRARKLGIGHLKLIPLTLSVNFRSTPTIVDWVNAKFQKILAPFEDISTGAVSYNPSIANDTNHAENSIVKIHVANNTAANQQAQEIIALILEKRRENPAGKIAILVRARQHLKHIIPALKKADLLYRAIKIDPLNARPVIQDLMALTRALLNIADKVAWLAILRAPWCGLRLADLLTLTSDKSIYETINDNDYFKKLSPDAQHRLRRVREVLNHKISERSRLHLAAWIKSTWLMLGGPACLEHLAELEDVNTYFALLEKQDHGGNLADLDNLDYDVSRLFAAPNGRADDSLQIMTIHNAKGLEFDTVILPHLEKKSRPDDKDLLLFMEKTREQHANALILAPLPAMEKTADKIYEYVRYQHKTKNNHEIGRLLYVAATRAKHNLHLFLTLPDENNISSSSLLGKLYPALKADITISPTIAVAVNEVKENPPRCIQRLTSDWRNPITEIGVRQVTQHQKLPGMQLTRETARFTGTVIHLVLQQISVLGCEWWQQQALERQHTYLNNQLRQEGVITSELAHARGHALQAITNALTDARGQWILANHHEAQTEFALTVVINNKPEQLKIDKTFVDDNNNRWIIDYKTTPFSGDDLEIFLTTEQEKYAEKMQHYYQAMRTLDEKPIHLGLYFPMVPAWREWVI